MRRLAVLLLAFAVAGRAAAQEPPTVNPDATTGFLPRTWTDGGREHRYVVYVPPGYSRQQRWPLLVFLNGKGECGTDGQRHVEVGLGPAIRAEPERWPFVVLFPQKPTRETWWPDHEAMLLAMIERTEQEFAIDAGRRLLTGLSQGGHGTWVFGAEHADRWAAIAPVCGFTLQPLDVRPLADVPIWAFHGDADRVVPAKASRDLVAAVRAIGGDPVLTIYGGVGHDSWTRAYRESDLAEWLRCAGVDRDLQRHIGALEQATMLSIVAGDAETSHAATSTGEGFSCSRSSPSLPGTPRVALPPAQGRVWLLEQLRRLLRAGVPWAAAGEGRRSITVHLQGPAGTLELQRVVPEDGPAAIAVAAFVRAVDALQPQADRR